MTWWVVIASGPSLTRADCDALRGIGPTIAVNRAVFFAPWADYLYAGDSGFWEVYGPDVAWFRGERITHQEYKDTCRFNGDHHFRRFGGDSGHQAFQYAAHKGGRRVALIGFDYQHTNGKAHFHSDYPRQVDTGSKIVSFCNAACTDYWVRLMNASAQDAQRIGLEVVNLSRETALTCFPRMTVEQFVRQC